MNNTNCVLESNINFSPFKDGMYVTHIDYDDFLVMDFMYGKLNAPKLARSGLDESNESEFALGTIYTLPAKLGVEQMAALDYLIESGYIGYQYKMEYVEGNNIKYAGYFFVIHETAPLDKYYPDSDSDELPKIVSDSLMTVLQMSVEDGHVKDIPFSSEYIYQSTCL